VIEAIVILFVLSLVAGFFGFTNVAGASRGLAKILFFVLLAIIVVFVIFALLLGVAIF